MVAVGIFVLLLIEGPASSVLRGVGLLAEPGHFTALYFSDPAALPTRLAVGEPLVFSFDINNQTSKLEREGWRTFIVSRNQTTTIQAGIADVAAGQISTVTIRTRAPVIKARTTVRVELDGTQQFLQFILEEGAG